MVWEIAIPLLAPDGQRRGEQIFTYPETEFRVSRDAKRRAAEDAVSASAVRHRRGARLDLSAARVRTRDLG